MLSMNLQPILNDCQFNESNFEVWFLNLKIILKHERIGYVIERPMSSLPTTTASPKKMKSYEMYKTDNDTTTCTMLASITSAL